MEKQRLFIILYYKIGKDMSVLVSVDLYSWFSLFSKSVYFPDKISILWDLCPFYSETVTAMKNCISYWDFSECNL